MRKKKGKRDEKKGNQIKQIKKNHFFIIKKIKIL